MCKCVCVYVKYLLCCPFWVDQEQAAWVRVNAAEEEVAELAEDIKMKEAFVSK